MRILAGIERILNAEAAIFDCDGTIIDTSGSYELAMRVSIALMIDKLFNIEVRLGKDFEDVLASLRMTGGFNNDSDSASALIQTICIFLPSTLDIKLKKWDTVKDVDKYTKPIEGSESYPEYVHEAFKWLSNELKTKKEYFDLNKVEKLLDVKASSLKTHHRLSKIRSMLGYPGNFGESFFATLFDEIFLGSEGVEKKYSWKPRYVLYKGTLENEILLISEESIRRLARYLPKGIAIVTGRGRWETEKTLSRVLKYFNMEASIFTADKGLEYEKPRPKALIESAKSLGTKKLIYAGNSMEDLLMSQAACREGLEVGFVAVSNNEDLSREFEVRGADAIIEDINQLPSLIENIRV
ncbi:MAG: hypothetical protein QXF28_06370 [Nitrososphaerota archaeon]